MDAEQRRLATVGHGAHAPDRGKHRIEPAAMLGIRDEGAVMQLLGGRVAALPRIEKSSHHILRSVSPHDSRLAAEAAIIHENKTKTTLIGSPMNISGNDQVARQGR